MEFKDRLKSLREEKDYTQLELSKLLSISNVTLSQYENGVRKPDMDTIKYLASFFDVSIDYLLGQSSNAKLNRKDERDIERDLEDMKSQLEDGTLRMNLDGEEIDDEIKEFIIQNMENTLILAKIKAKEKFTPKKHKK